MKRHLGAALALVLLPLAAQAAGPAGTIEICRVRMAGDRHQGKDINIPKGAVFGDAGVLENGEKTGNYWPLWIATSEPLTLPGKDNCVRGRAEIKQNLDRHSLTVAERRWFVPSGSAASSDEWPGDYDLGATVTTDFR